MPRILTVDDSRAIRMIVAKQVQEMGFEVEEAENGEEGLAKLEELTFELILLDVTMPVLDGPAMLARLRETGNKTPVVMLTSESKRSIVAELMKLKIEDYILKPFKTDELRAKILKALKQPAGAPAPAAAPSERPAMAAVAPAPVAAPTAEGGRQFGDILVIDDMENVTKKVRTLTPTHLSVAGVLNGQAALALCRERTFRLILIDRELPDVPASSLLRQLRVLQPSAACFATTLRSANNVIKEVRDEGFDGVFYKPFTTEATDDLILQFFDSQLVLERHDNVLAPGAFTGREDRLDRYYTRLLAALQEETPKVAEACFEHVILDARQMPAQDARNAQLVQTLGGFAASCGLSVTVVGTEEVAKALKAFTETSDVPVLATVEAARAVAA